MDLDSAKTLGFALAVGLGVIGPGQLQRPLCRAKVGPPLLARVQDADDVIGIVAEGLADLLGQDDSDVPV